MIWVWRGVGRFGCGADYDNEPRCGLVMWKFLGNVALAVILACPAGAADMPVKAPLPAVVADGWYAWIDGSSQNIRLPTYDLGIKGSTPSNFTTAAASFDPRATGYGISGAIGYVLPTGSPLAWFGSRTRIEIDGAYVSATASQTSA